MNWKTEFKDAIRNLNDLSIFFSNNPLHQKALPDSFDQKSYPIFIPKKIAIQIRDNPPHSSLWNQFIPSKKELKNESGLIDPIGDQLKQTAPQLIHRYKNRVLFIPTTICPINCRYCFRKNELNSSIDLFKKDFDKTIQYLKSHTEVNEIIFTGGDPFILDTPILSNYIHAFKQVKHIKYIRFHSRVPISMPSRFDNELIELLKKAKEDFIQIKIIIHVNHIDEFNLENIKTLKELSKRFSLLSQSVLLKDVNNNSQTLIELCYKLIDLNIRPYYLHHPDQVKGAEHFQISIDEGEKIYSRLRDELPGWALPQYVIDSADGSGKRTAI